MRKFQWLKGPNQGSIDDYLDTITEDGIDFLIFKSGRRVAAELVGDYIMEMSEAGSIITNDIFKSSKIVSSYEDNPLTRTAFNQATPRKERVLSQANSQKSDSFSLTDLIKSKLAKGNTFINVTLEVPVLDKNLFGLLNDSYPELLNDLSAIIIEKSLNLDVIKTEISSTLKQYYLNDLEEQVEEDYIKVETNEM